MKKKYLYGLSLLVLLTLGGCSNLGTATNTDPVSVDGTRTSIITNSEDYSYTEPSSYYNSSVDVSTPEEISVEDNTGEFAVTTTDGEYEKANNIYTLKKAGTYSLSGNLEGQILVEAGEDDEVVIELNNVSISYDQDSPIKALTAGKVEISAKKDTGNSVIDNRKAKTVDTDTLGEGAIYAKTDLKLKGSGTLVVEGNYNNGVHTSKDLTIQKLSLKVTGYNNALKGNNSITVTSGNVQAYAKTGNGLKSEDTDLTSKGKQKGTIAINGGTVYVDSLHDAIDASYNIEIDQLDDTVPTELTVKTGTNASYYSKSSFTADSEKGLKAQNDIIVNKGTVAIKASDDAIHANYGTTLDNGSKGTGNITINDGLIQVASGDDGLHADNTLTINGGKVIVTGATEGYEGNYININGGYSYIYGTDDGVNCSKKSFNNCAFTMSGGYLDVAVKNGDTDGIDSNGNFTLSGGVIVTRGSPGTSSQMSTGLDVDGTCSMTGGTLIAFNGLERSPSTASGIYYAGTTSQGNSGRQGMGGRPGQGGPGGQSGTSSVNLAAGNYVLSGQGVNISFTNDYSYGNFLVYSSSMVNGASYTLSKEGSTVLSWTQSSTSVTIS